MNGGYKESVELLRSSVPNGNSCPASINASIQYMKKYSPIYKCSALPDEKIESFRICHDPVELKVSNEILSSNFLCFVKVLIHFTILCFVGAVILYIVYLFRYADPILSTPIGISSYSYFLFNASILHVGKKVLIITPIVSAILTMIIIIVGNKVFDRVANENKTLKKSFRYNINAKSTLMITANSAQITYQQFYSQCQDIVDPSLYYLRGHVNQNDWVPFDNLDDVRSITVAMDIRDIHTRIEMLSNYEKMQQISRYLQLDKNVFKPCLLLCGKSSTILTSGNTESKIVECENYIEKKCKELHPSYYAFVTFPSHSIRNGVMNDIAFRKHNVHHVSQSPLLDDIIWKNLSYSPSERKCRVFAILLIASVFIILILFANIRITSSIEGFVAEHSESIGLFVAIQVLSIAITLINLICVTIIGFMLEMEKSLTKSSYLSHSAYYLTAFYSIVSIIIPPVSYIYHNWGSGAIFIDLLFNKGEILSRIVSNWISLAIIPGILEIINIRFLFYYCRKWLFPSYDTSNSISGFQRCFTQSELNEVYIKPYFNYPTNYSNVMILMFYTMAYVTIFPLGVIITLFGFFFTYWPSKFMIINAYKSHYNEKDSIIYSAITICKVISPCILIIVNILIMVAFSDGLIELMISIALFCIVIIAIGIIFYRRQQSRTMEKGVLQAVLNPLLGKSLTKEEMKEYATQNPYTKYLTKVNAIQQTRTFRNTLKH